MEKIPEVVVFDLGKVLVDFDYGIAARKIAQRCTTSACDLQALLDQSPLLHRYESGQIDTEEFFSQVRSTSTFAGHLDEFGELFSDIFTPVEPMLQIQAALRTADIPTYIFSNTNELAIRHIRQRYPFFKTFVGFILSFEHGAMKPDPRVYEVVERKTGQSGSAILYLDDRAENLETAKTRGWRTIFHETPEKTRCLMEQLGLPVGDPFAQR